ncbi:VWA domain-containing protein [Nitrogeniibacter mangrovi]|uniref:VWA domain-containing protein n=1 Tax=Nitrogeniibacter mangrovi TaxID=2016596 RepID=A0A6C1AYP3_9RHOO|nr:VWA domain-containing protein [Nitrogeniibacter mangrovi]QID16457.1 VWA domain-containing protein [Nitrogeniibacter mangrovi]
MQRLPLIAAALLLGACSTQNQPSNPPVASKPVAPRPAAIPEQAAAVADQAAAPAPSGKAEVLAEPMRNRAPRAAGMMSLEAKRMVHPAPMPYALPEDRERYQALDDNPAKVVAEAPVSTFSIDVDTGSWANVRRFLNEGRLPPMDAVRVEEFINYFPYDYVGPTDARPFAVHTELARSPWNAHNVLMRVAIKGRDVAKATLPPANLVFLVDVSGSMNSRDKLPLLKSALKLLVRQLRAEDRIALVTYAGRAGVVLPATPGNEKATILAAIDALQSGGSTAGASGIELAYRTARAGFVKDGINRILLATDGDFNVGLTDFRQLKQRVERERASGVSLSTLGFGTGNFNEQLMEQMADAGDGAYSYIDTLMEGHKVLVNEMSSTLATIARDVKIQVEFNPATVREYRLIGYENRRLAREDFNNDKVDAGDIGAGHTVTALYELTPVEAPGLIEPLRYGTDPRPSDARRDELALVRLRYKQPGEATSRLMERPVARSEARDIAAASADFRFATAIAGFGQRLRGGKYTGQWSLSQARALAASALGPDRFGYRGEALRLMDLASALTPGKEPVALQ